MTENDRKVIELYSRQSINYEKTIMFLTSPKGIPLIPIYNDIELDFALLSIKRLGLSGYYFKVCYLSNPTKIVRIPIKSDGRINEDLLPEENKLANLFCDLL